MKVETKPERIALGCRRMELAASVGSFNRHVLEEDEKHRSITSDGRTLRSLPAPVPQPTRPRGRQPPDAVLPPPRVGRSPRLLCEQRTADLPASFSRRRSRVPHTRLPALRVSATRPPRRTTRLANFNRHRALFCCSGVCYSRCPRRREHYLARS